ncbi:hypothetical protein GW17_00052177 [Ensete ventricosum]|nr:hypothetical protein GW17_00052177 [Ensete ventricosum]RZS25306.1 hypothetical protein BHM03_00058485 [Ensete ventricosum]
MGLLPLRVATPWRGPGRNRPPLYKGALAVTGRPLQGAWPQPATPLQGALAVAYRPCKGVGHGHTQLPLTRASFTTKT